LLAGLNQTYHAITAGLQPMGEIASKVEENRGRKGLPRGGETTRFQRGRQKTGGRKKGTPNRFTDRGQLLSRARPSA
jgi:hypothetical protein